MSHRPHRARSERRDEHARLLRARGDRRGIGEAFLEAEDDDVGLHRREVEPDPGNAGELLGDEAGIGVVFREPRHIVVERVQPGGGEDARLPHRAAEHAAYAHGTRDPCFVAGEDAADGAAAPLRQRDRHEIEGPRQFGQAEPACGSGVEQPRAVEIGGNARLARRGANPNRIGLREHDPAPEIMRVLDRDEPGRRQHDMPRPLQRGPEFRRAKEAAPSDGRELHAGIGRAGTGFVPDHMGVFAEDHLVARPCQQLQRDLVRHRAARHEQRRLLAQQFGDPILQPVDRRVLAVLIVADRRFRHRPPHRGRGPRHRVRAQIDQTGGLNHRRRSSAQTWPKG